MADSPSEGRPPTNAPVEAARLQLTVRQHDPTVVEGRGELDVATAPDLSDVLNPLIDGGHRHIVLDFTEVTFIDVAGMRACAEARARLRTLDGRLQLTGISPLAREVAVLTGLADLLDQPS